MNVLDAVVPAAMLNPLALAVNVNRLMLVAVATPKVGVIRDGEVVSTTVEPVPLTP